MEPKSLAAIELRRHARSCAEPLGTSWAVYNANHASRRPRARCECSMPSTAVCCFSHNRSLQLTGMPVCWLHAFWWTTTTVLLQHRPQARLPYHSPSTLLLSVTLTLPLPRPGLVPGLIPIVTCMIMHAAGSKNMGLYSSSEERGGGTLVCRVHGEA